MKKPEFIAAVKALGLQADEYIVIGSGVMCALGIRESDDVDLCVTPEIFKRLEQQGWQKKTFPDDPTYYLTSGIYEVGIDWDSQDSVPNLDNLKADQLIIDDVPFVSLDRLTQWKSWKGTQKHLNDIETIQQFQKGAKA